MWGYAERRYQFSLIGRLLLRVLYSLMQEEPPLRQERKTLTLSTWSRFPYPPKFVPTTKGGRGIKTLEFRKTNTTCGSEETGYD